MTPCPSNPLGIKGCGEAGAIAAPPAVINAITDALGHEDVAMPATPEAVWRACQTRPSHKLRGRVSGISRGDQSHVRLRLSPPDHACGRREPRCSPRHEDAKLLAGGHTLLPTMKQRLAQPADADRSRRHRRSSRGIERTGRVVVDRRHDDACRGRDLAPSCSEAIPALAELAEHDRRSGSAQPRHHRRLDRQQRPGGRLSRRACLALGATIVTNKRKIAADEFFTGLFETALEDGEIVTAVAFPMPAQGGLREVPQPGLALRAGRRLRRQARAPMSASR